MSTTGLEKPPIPWNYRLPGGRSIYNPSSFEQIKANIESKEFNYLTDDVVDLFFGAIAADMPARVVVPCWASAITVHANEIARGDKLNPTRSSEPMSIQRGFDNAATYLNIHNEVRPRLFMYPIYVGSIAFDVSNQEQAIGHWILGVYNKVSNTFVIYDSLRRFSSSHMSKIAQLIYFLIYQEVRDQAMTSRAVIKQAVHVEQQQDGWTCGYRMCAMAQVLAGGYCTSDIDYVETRSEASQNKLFCLPKDTLYPRLISILEDYWRFEPSDELEFPLYVHNKESRFLMLPTQKHLNKTKIEELSATLRIRMRMAEDVARELPIPGLEYKPYVPKPRTPKSPPTEVVDIDGKTQPVDLYAIRSASWH
jgi:hypothetical protein